jgi:TPR repeat protein
MLRSIVLTLTLLLGPSLAFGQGSSGTGFAIAPGLVVTNHHVVAGCSSLSIVLPGQERRPAQLIAQDTDADLALVYALGLPGSVASLRTAPARLGEQVYAFGFPLAGALSSSGNFTSGLVSALRGLRDREGELQFSAPIQPGNSGGALLDRSGLVIGVVQSKLDAIRAARVTGDIAQNVNFAVSGEVLARFLSRHQANVAPRPAGEPVDTVAIAERAQNFSFRISCASATRAASPQAATPTGPAAPPPPEPPLDSALAALRREAEAGNASAQFDLAARHASGDGVPQDWATAFSLFERAARQGLATAQHNLGVLLERGHGAVPDPERAISWYGEAARQGYAPSQYNLALALLRRGNPADMDAAVDWLVRAAADLPQAHLPLAQIFEGGAGSRRDLGRARDHYAQAAAAGDPRAAARLAELTPDVVARETMREIQELLARLNFDPGVADGRPGPRSQAAIRRFQRANGLKEDGQASQLLLDRLRRAASDG